MLIEAELEYDLYVTKAQNDARYCSRRYDDDKILISGMMEENGTVLEI